MRKHCGLFRQVKPGTITSFRPLDYWGGSNPPLATINQLTMKYYIRINHELKPKNALHREVQTLAHSIDRILIDDTQLDQVIRNFRNGVVKLNQKHFRCTALEVKVFHPNYDVVKDWTMHINEVVSITISYVKGEVEL